MRKIPLGIMLFFAMSIGVSASRPIIDIARGLLNTANTWLQAQTFSSGVTVNGTLDSYDLHITSVCADINGGYIINFSTDCNSVVSCMRIRNDGKVSFGYNSGVPGTSFITIEPWTGNIVSSGTMQLANTLMVGSGIKITHNGNTTTAYTLYSGSMKSLTFNTITNGFLRHSINDVVIHEIATTSVTIKTNAYLLGGNNYIGTLPINVKGYSFDAALRITTPALYDVYWSTDSYCLWIASGTGQAAFRVISSGITP